MKVTAVRDVRVLLVLVLACFVVVGLKHPGQADDKEREHTPANTVTQPQGSSTQTLPPEVLSVDRQAFEKAADYAQRITDSISLIFAGSIVVLLGTGYRRPVSRWMRATYLIFPIGWVFLWLSVSNGMKVRGTYIDYLLAPPKNNVGRLSRISTLDHFAVVQTNWLFRGLGIFALWLMIYLCWWIQQSDAEGEKENAA